MDHCNYTPQAANAPPDWQTRQQWFLAGRIVRDGVDGLEMLSRTGRRFRVFDLQDTRPASPRQLAYASYWGIFGETAKRDEWIQWSYARDRWEHAYSGQWCGLFPAVLSHLNYSRQLGIKSNGQTRFVAVDVDLHGRSAAVFLDQVGILLDRFWGRSTWHMQLRSDGVSGIHLLQVFARPQPLAQVVADLRRELAALDAQFPELADRARQAGMPSFAGMEVYPSETRGFRLPLCAGREIVADGVFGHVTVRKRQAGDVERYTGWLADPARLHLPKAEVMALLRDRLGVAGGGKQTKDDKLTPFVPTFSEDTAAKQVKQSPLESRPTVNQAGKVKLRNQTRKVLSEFWGGTVAFPGQLNELLLVSARILKAEGLEQEQAATWIKDRLRNLPPENSKRLQRGEWRELEYDATRSTARAFRESVPREIQVAVDERWKQAGWRLSEPETWRSSWSSFAGIPDFQFTAEEEAAIRERLTPALGGAKYAGVAVDVARSLVKLAYSMHARGDGISKRYLQAFLADACGIPMGHDEKVSRVIRVAVDLGLWAVHSWQIYRASNPGSGRARQYRPGGQFRSRLPVSVSTASPLATASPSSVAPLSTASTPSPSSFSAPSPSLPSPPHNQIHSYCSIWTEGNERKALAPLEELQAEYRRQREERWQRSMAKEAQTMARETGNRQ